MAKLGLVKLLSGLEGTSESQNTGKGYHEALKTEKTAYAILNITRYLNNKKLITSLKLFSPSNI